MARTIETKIRREILNPVFEIQEIRSHWVHRLGWLNAYLAEAVVALSALGFSIEVATRSIATAETTAYAPGVEDSAISLGWFGGAIVVLVLALRGLNNIHKISERHVMGRSALARIKGFESRIEEALDTDDDEVATISKYVEDTIGPAFSAARENDCIPDHSDAAKQRMRASVDACIERLRIQFPEKLTKAIAGRQEPANV